VISGRLYHADGSIDYQDYYKDPNIGPSRHFTYIFNIFVLLQLTNEINSRKLRDEINVFKGIFKNKMFIIIWLFTFFMQVLIVSVGSFAFSVHISGLTVEQWFICFAYSLISLVWRLVLVIVPSKVFPQVKVDNGRGSARVLTIRGSSLSRERVNLNPI
jgi:Ca2+ transporting ATPase